MKFQISQYKTLVIVIIVIFFFSTLLFCYGREKLFESFSNLHPYVKERIEKGQTFYVHDYRNNPLQSSKRHQEEVGQLVDVKRPKRRIQCKNVCHNLPECSDSNYECIYDFSPDTGCTCQFRKISEGFQSILRDDILMKKSDNKPIFISKGSNFMPLHDQFDSFTTIDSVLDVFDQKSTHVWSYKEPIENAKREYDSLPPFLQNFRGRDNMTIYFKLTYSDSFSTTYNGALGGHHDSFPILEFKTNKHILSLYSDNKLGLLGINTHINGDKSSTYTYLPSELATQIDSSTPFDSTSQYDNLFNNNNNNEYHVVISLTSRTPVFYLNGKKIEYLNQPSSVIGYDIFDNTDHATTLNSGLHFNRTNKDITIQNVLIFRDAFPSDFVNRMIPPATP